MPKTDPGSSPFLRLHVCKQQLEPIAQRPHVLVRDLTELVCPRDHLHLPVLHRCMLPSLKTEVEVPGILRIDTEAVHRSFRIGFRVGGQPTL